jgi:hypothetical protein
MPLCTVCHRTLPREDFSKAQLTKKPAHQRKCKPCAEDLAAYTSTQHLAAVVVANTASDDGGHHNTAAPPDGAVVAVPDSSTDEDATEALEATLVRPEDDVQDHDRKDNDCKNHETTTTTTTTATASSVGGDSSLFGVTTATWDAREVVERAKQRMCSLEELAADAVRSLNEVQAQTAIELETLRSSLLQVQGERDALKQQVVDLLQREQQQRQQQ